MLSGETAILNDGSPKAKLPTTYVKTQREREQAALHAIMLND